MTNIDYDSDDSAPELTEKERKEIERKRRKNNKKKESKKRAKQNGHDNGVNNEIKEEKMEVEEGLDPKQFVLVPDQIDHSDPNFKEFANVFAKFNAISAEELHKSVEIVETMEKEAPMDTLNRAAISEKILQEEMDAKRKEEGDYEQNLSRKKLRLSMQPSIAALKANTTRSDVVEWADVTSRDPHLLVHLKAYRNTVQVPRHWNAKRKYLAGKRGFERPPFELPDFIKRTGIQEMRETMWEKEDAQSLKSKMRERMRPKLGRIDIDYQKLHDAFFKWQTKPVMTRMGELYYEGKEMETQMKDKKPGILSDELRIALGMPVGPTAIKFPPPWLIAMQRYGPPPSYPNLKIPGLNCPIPEGCSFGYHAGGWGKPPVDEFGKPLYGDVFGLEMNHGNEPENEAQIERRHWGEIGSEEEESDEESEPEEDEEEEAQQQTDGLTTPAPTEGMITPSGISTVPGIETPDSIQLRKKHADEASIISGGTDTPAGPLYTILPEKKVERLGKDIMASTHFYEIGKKQSSGYDGVEISLNPEELDLGDKKGLEQKYEEQLRKETSSKDVDPEENFSDMVAENNRRKRRAEQKKPDAESKKYKEFKF